MNLVAGDAEEHERAGHEELDVVRMGCDGDGGLHGQETGVRSQESGVGGGIFVDEARGARFYCWKGPESALEGIKR